jgi:hypoxanthine phosphoribosyltransferase
VADTARATGAIPDDDVMPAMLVVTWEALDGLVARLAERVGRDHDLVLAITRGGLVPAGMLAYRLDLREILVAGAIFYLPEGGTHPSPVIGHFPDDSLLVGQRVLVVDEVWETGETMTEVMARVRAAGGHPVSAVIHYKPGRSRVAGAPDHYADTVHDWVTYPYKAGG